MTRQRQIKDPITIGIVIERDLRDKIIGQWGSPTAFLKACIDHSLSCDKFNQGGTEISRVRYQWAFDFMQDMAPSAGVESTLNLLKVTSSWRALSEQESSALEKALREYAASWKTTLRA